MKRYLFFPDATTTIWSIATPMVTYNPDSSRTVNLSSTSNATTYLWEQIEPDPNVTFATITPNNTTKNIVVTMPVGVNIVRYRVTLNGNTSNYKYVDILDFWRCSGGVCVQNATSGYLTQAQCESYLIPPSFTGGQCLEASYTITTTTEYFSFGSLRTETTSATTTGKILSANVDFLVPADNYGKCVRFVTSSGTFAMNVVAAGGSFYYELISISIVRTDGLPDTCGNLPSICPPPPKWKCISGVCVIDSTGTYDSQAECQAALIPPPFMGGQSLDITYTITVTVRYTGTFGVIRTTTQSFFFVGKILSVVVATYTSDGSIGKCTLVTTSTISNEVIAVAYGVAEFPYEILSVSIVRSDGLPDTGGNLPSTCP